MKILKVTKKILIGETQSSFQKNLIIGLLILCLYILEVNTIKACNKSLSHKAKINVTPDTEVIKKFCCQHEYIYIFL